MKIATTPEMEQFIQKLIDSGRYVTPSEIFRDALRLLMDREHIREHHIEDLRREIQEGLDSLDRGEGIDGDEAFAQTRQMMAAKSKE